MQACSSGSRACSASSIGCEAAVRYPQPICSRFWPSTIAWPSGKAPASCRIAQSRGDQTRASLFVHPQPTAGWAS
eukprot:411379-Lingulodinium_polyedra.AAC.1